MPIIFSFYYGTGTVEPIDLNLNSILCWKHPIAATAITGNTIAGKARTTTWPWTWPTRTTVLGDFNDVEFSLHGITSRFYKKDGKFFVHTNGPGRCDG